MICLLPTYYAQLCLSRLHQHLSASCWIFQAQYASPSPERCLRSSAFPNQTDNLSLRSLRCFSRKSKNYSFSRLVPSLLHGGRWSLVCLQIPKPNCNLEWFAFCPHIMPSCAFQNCTRTWVLFVKYFKHKMLPHPQSVAKTGSTFPALQRECQLRSSAFPNQTDNLSLRCFSRKSKNRARCAFKSGEATQGERGAEANSLTFQTQESFGSQADASICSSFTPRLVRQVKLHLQRMPKNNSSCCW